jgi:hypothetical protein
VNDQEKRVSALSLCEYNIKPKWEDVINEQGGEFRLDFKANIATV